jgi:AcrR family transcriptional regulator
MNEITITKGEATRARIVAAAYQLFMAQGFHATSMRQIVEKAGITMGGIYTHFASKEAIWKAVFLAKHPYHEILALLTQAGGDTVGDFLRQAAALLINGLGQRQDVLNLLFIELVEFNGQHLSMIYSEALPELARLGQIFAQKQGTLRPVPMPILVRSFAGLFFSYFITEQVLPEGARALMGEHALETFVDIYLHGILAEPQGEPPHA